MSNIVRCPVCQALIPISSSDQPNPCPQCGWIHDDFGESNPLDPGLNRLSLREYRLRYDYYKSQDPNYRWEKYHFPEIPQIKEGPCPVCGKTAFRPLTWDEIYCGTQPADVYCRQCGWHYDPNQTQSPDLKNGANELSLSEYRVRYSQFLADDPDYSFFEEECDSYIPQPHPCPVCGKYLFPDICCFSICPQCGWEDDGTEDSSVVGANTIPFREYKATYLKRLAEDPLFRWETSIKH